MVSPSLPIQARQKTLYDASDYKNVGSKLLWAMSAIGRKKKKTSGQALSGQKRYGKPATTTANEQWKKLGRQNPVEQNQKSKKILQNTNKN